MNILSYREECALSTEQRRKYYTELREYVKKRKLTNTTKGAEAIAPRIKWITNKIARMILPFFAGGGCEYVTEGIEHIPEGAVIFAHTHQGVLDHFAWIPVTHKKFGEKVKERAKGRFVFIDASGAVFAQKVVLNDMSFLVGSTFAGAMFLDDVCISGDVVKNEKNSKYRKSMVTMDFRNVRFSKKVSIVNLKYNGADYDETEMNFEDAVFKPFVDDEGRENISVLEISDCSLPRCKWNFFQAIMNQGKIYFRNMNMCNAVVIFQKSLCDKVFFQNINEMAEAYLEFDKVNLVELIGCVFNNPITIKNVESFGLVDCTNYSTITSNENWDSADAKQVDAKKIEKRKNVHPLLKATQKHDETIEETVRHKICKEQYAILKKSFQEAGMYDAEDEALIRFMDYSSKKIICRPLYMFLKCTGGYGKKPGRVLISMLISGSVSTILYCINSTECKTLWQKRYIGVSSILSFGLKSGKCVPLDIVLLLLGFLNWFLLGYFSIAVVRKTLR